jgi:hypothetical protein
MSGVYKASRKSEGKDGKTYWNQVGFTVFVGEYEGKPSVTLVDERTGEKYPCFPPKARAAGEREAPPISHDDAPF